MNNTSAPSTPAAVPTSAERGIRWFHSFDFGDGEVIQGQKGGGLRRLRAEADTTFRDTISGQSVLDIGAWDGYFSFEAERRGASDVLATDHYCWSGPGWGTKAGFDYAHTKISSRVRSLDVDVFDLSPEKHGRFDIVLFLGVLYHLKNPLGGLDVVSRMTKSHAVVETVVDRLGTPEPVMRFYRGAELNNDASNFFAPNDLCLEGMLREVGFKRVVLTLGEPPNGTPRNRMYAHAWK